MSSLQVTARFTVHEGKLGEFKALAEQCMESVREKDSGTLQYDWFFSEDESEWVVQESYRDSDAVLEHFGNLGDLLGRIAAVADLKVEVFGTPSAELAEAAAAMAPRVYAKFQGI